METPPPDETIEIDDQSWIVLVFDRVWPKYVVSWSIRRRAGDSDYPLSRGEVDALPRSEQSPEEIWQSLRDRATEAATAAAESVPKSASSPSFFSRLLGRR